MTLKIISAEKTVFEGDVESVTLPGSMGGFTVLAHHASLVSTLIKGVISYRDETGEHRIGVEGGIADVDNDIVSVCVY